MRRCPYCGANAVITDYERGMLVCTACGSVIEEDILDVSGGTYRQDEIQLAVVRRGIVVRPEASKIEALAEAVEEAKQRAWRRITAILRLEKAEDARALERLFSQVNLETIEEVADMLRVVKMLGSRKSMRMKIALAHALVIYKRGRYPDLARLARLYQVDPARLRQAFRELLRKEPVRAKLRLA